MRYKQHLQMLFLLCKVYRIWAEVTSDIFGRFADKPIHTLQFMRHVTNALRCNGFVAGPNSAGSFYVLFYYTLL